MSHEGRHVLKWPNDVMNERIYTHQSQNNKASLTWHAAKFGSNSYIRQKRTLLSAFVQTLTPLSKRLTVSTKDFINRFYLINVRDWLHLAFSLLSIIVKLVDIFETTNFQNLKTSFDTEVLLTITLKLSV